MSDFMKPKGPKIQFRVCYKPNPKYEGHWHAKLKPGIHAVVDHIQDAKEQAEKCKRFFQDEKVNRPKMVEGKMTDDVKVTVHDNVIVWIDELQDGVVVEPQKVEQKKVA
jgi:hypothetical protein